MVDLEVVERGSDRQAGRPGSGHRAIDHRSHVLAPLRGTLGRPAPSTPQEETGEEGAQEDQHRGKQRRQHDAPGEPAHDDDQESVLRSEDRCADDA